MDSNGLRSLPRRLFQNSSRLQMLDLAAGGGHLMNRLRKLPPTLFEGLTDLRGLSLEGHGLDLDGLPAGLLAASAKRLRRLVLAGNTVRGSSGNVEDLKRLSVMKP